MRSLGIVAHSVEGASLCLLSACRYAGESLGPFMHPNIVLSAVPMALSMPAWEAGDHDEVARHLGEGIRTVAAAGADIFVCPDNTAHIVLERMAGEFPIPGLHIAEVACAEAERLGSTRVGLLGTEWTMTGPVYERALARRGMARMIPDDRTRGRLHDAIFAELCKGIFTVETTGLYVRAIRELKERGAECVVLGCTEIPLIITEENSALPVIDSTRLLARYAVDACLNGSALESRDGWLVV